MNPAVVAATPQPPIHLEMPQTAELVFTIAGAIPLVVLVGLGIRHLTAGRGPLLLLCLLGGLLASLFEPFVDVMGLVYLPENGAIGTFTFLDRQMPLFVPLIYPWYVGGLAYLAYRMYERGIDRAGIFKLWLLCVVIDYALELPAIITDVYTYYGNQPFNVWGHPMWWAFMHALVAIAGGAVIYGFRHALRGPAMLLVVPILFIADGAVNAGTAWPLYIALDADQPYGVTYLAGLTTIALAASCVWLIAAAVGRPAGTPAPEPGGGPGVPAPAPDDRPGAPGS